MVADKLRQILWLEGWDALYILFNLLTSLPFLRYKAVNSKGG